MALLPAFLPNPQGKNSTSFHPPPLDGSLSLPQIFDFHSENSSSHPLFVYDASGPSGLIHITWKEAVQATQQAAQYVRSRVESVIKTDNSTPPVIGLLATGDPITYYFVLHGLLRAGFIPFPISPRNSSMAIAHLLRQTGTNDVFVSSDGGMQSLASASLEELERDSGNTYSHLDVHFHAMPTFHELFPSSDGDLQFLPAPPNFKLEDTALVLHSSGSAAFPKPVYITHRILIQWLRIPWYGELDLCGEVMGLLPMIIFHAGGAIATSMPASCGVILAAFKPGEPSSPSPEKAFEVLVATNCTLAFTGPPFVMSWTQNEDNIKLLAKLKAVITGGAAMSREIGTVLSKQGVRLVQLYGITEVGVASVFVPKDVQDDEWEYFRISSQYHTVFKPQNDENGTVEFQVLSCPSHTPAVLNIKIGESPGYATNDLLIEHPTKQGHYKVFGRADDQIVLSNGEKTNPVPLENIISKHPLVAGAVIFGHGFFQNGVIIQPTDGMGFDPSNNDKKLSYIASTWHVIDQANAYAPTHSRLFKEMIIIATPSKPFTLTAKGSVRRSAVIADYRDEIEATYASVEESFQSSVKNPSRWDKENISKFVREVVVNVLGREIGDGEDIFQSGGDSLQATWIRNSIMYALRHANFSVQQISQNFVYAFPTITQLSEFVHNIANLSTPKSPYDSEAEIETLIQKYGADFPSRTVTPLSSASPPPTTETILLTGSTGGLGSAILAQLLASQNISKVYAFNRRRFDSISSKSLRERQFAAFKERGFDLTLLDSSKLILVEGDLAEDNLEIAYQLYVEMQRTVTSIIHTAWRVNFSIGLPSFEPLIKGLRRLIDLALGVTHDYPVRFLFASSSGIFTNWTSSTPSAELPITSVEVVVGSGYAESKFVAERILELCAQKTSLRPVVVRCGQLSGAKNGFWNEREWFPALVRSGQVLGCFPRIQGIVSWIPLETAAKATIQMLHSPYPFVHLAHPRPVHWSTISDYLVETLAFPVVSYHEWFSKLESEARRTQMSRVDATRKNPAILLLQFFRNYLDVDMEAEDREAIGTPRFSVEHALRVAPVLREEELPELCRQDVEKWMRYWKMSGFLQ